MNVNGIGVFLALCIIYVILYAVIRFGSRFSRREEELEVRQQLREAGLWPDDSGERQT